MNLSNLLQINTYRKKINPKEPMQFIQKLQEENKLIYLSINNLRFKITNFKQFILIENTVLINFNFNYFMK